MPHFLAAETSIKQDGGILSTADLATQAALVRGLRQIIDCPVLGEEMTEQEQRDLWFHNYDGLWVVDPIDGTTNFVNGFSPLCRIGCLYSTRQTHVRRDIQPRQR